MYIARKFESTGIGIEDLISIGTIGLIKAVNTFCPARNIKLATYASRCIENEILMYLRKIQNQKTEVSIDEPLNVDWDGNELLLSDILGTDGDTVNRELEQEVERSALRGLVSGLGEREQRIMRLRFGLDGGEERTQKEVADIIGSRNPISRGWKRRSYGSCGRKCNRSTEWNWAAGQKTPAVSFMRRKGENSRQNIMKCCCNGRG